MDYDLLFITFNKTEVWGVLYPNLFDCAMYWFYSTSDNTEAE